MYNARRMSQFFPTEHGEEFLSEWYDWETEMQPEVTDAVYLEVAGDGKVDGEVAVEPVVQGPAVDPQRPIAVPPAPVLRRSTRPTKAPDRLGIRKK